MQSLFIPGLVFSVSMGYAQTARDYFFPAHNKNLSVYNSLTDRDRNQKATKIYTKDYGDSALITTQSNLVVNTNNIARPDTWEQSVKISRLEITAVRGKAKSENGIETFDNKGEILFKIPAKKREIVEWSSSRQKGALKTIYRSEFTTVKVNGTKRRAVKVSCIQKRKHSGDELVFYVDYYVEGIGRYKRGTEHGIDLEVLAKQEFDPHVPLVN